MTEHADHRFSATLSSPDLALIGCLQALAKFSQETGNNIIPCEGTEEKDWRAAGQKVTFRFSTALYAIFSKMKCAGFCLQISCALTP